MLFLIVLNHESIHLDPMNNKNLSDEIMSHLQLQKEYMGLDLEEKALRFVAALALGLGMTLLCSLLLYLFLGYIATFVFLFLLLISIAYAANGRHRQSAEAKTAKAEEIRQSQHRLHQQLSVASPSPDLMVDLCRTFHYFRHIIREIKFLWKGKGD